MPENDQIQTNEPLTEGQQKILDDIKSKTDAVDQADGATQEPKAEEETTGAPV